MENFEQILAIFEVSAAVVGGIAFLVATEGAGAPASEAVIDAAATDFAADSTTAVTATELQSLAAAGTPARLAQAAEEADISLVKLQSYARTIRAVSGVALAVGGLAATLSDGYTLFVCDASAPRGAFGNPGAMYKAEYVMRTKDHIEWVIDDQLHNPKMWSPWKP
ncbi:MAG: hypothetical protein AB7Q42_10470 [Acidimicrobiia bacterium]